MNEEHILIDAFNRAGLYELQDRELVKKCYDVAFEAMCKLSGINDDKDRVSAICYHDNIENDTCSNCDKTVVQWEMIDVLVSEQVIDSLKQLNIIVDATPTQSSVMKWLREKYSIHVLPKPVIGNKNGYDSYPIIGWDYDIISNNIGSSNSYYMGYPILEWFTAIVEKDETIDDINIHAFDSVELAINDGLIKALKIINNEKISKDYIDNRKTLLCKQSYDNRYSKITNGKSYELLYVYNEYVLVIDDYCSPSVFLNTYFNGI